MGRYEHRDTTPYVPILSEIEKMFKIETKSDEVTDLETGKIAKGSGFSREEAEQDAFKNLKSGSDSGSSSSSSGSNKGGCYLTTACTMVMGLSDDCFELQVLRRFRDKTLLPIVEGKRAVREYYSVAPEIVEAVSQSECPSIVWNFTYGEILKAVRLVLQGSFKEAFDHYRELAMSLKKRCL